MLSAVLATFVTSAALTPVLAAWARRRRFLDVPNERSSHVVATPRLGGVAIVLAVLVGYVTLFVLTETPPREGMIVMGGAVVVAVLGLVDDLRRLSPLVRLIVQVLAASVVVTLAGPIPLLWIGSDGATAVVIGVLWIVAVTNAYNFMDGIDGIAGGHAVVAGIGWVFVGWVSGWTEIVMFGLLISTSAAGFLLHNWQPAKVFMGDAGSGFLGFLFAALAVVVPETQAPAQSLAVLMLWPFLFDTGFTLIRRACRGQNVLSAHRSHIYQRLVQTGRSHAQVSLIYSGMATLGAGAAIALARGRTGVLFTACLLSLAAAILVWRSAVTREAEGAAEPTSARRR